VVPSPEEEREGGLGVVAEPKEGLREEFVRKSDSVQLKRGLQWVERVVLGD
jgi:hypothetical protein